MRVASKALIPDNWSDLGVSFDHSGALALRFTGGAREGSGRSSTCSSSKRGTLLNRPGAKRWIDRVQELANIEAGRIRHHDRAKTIASIETHHAMKPAATFFVEEPSAIAVADVPAERHRNGSSSGCLLRRVELAPGVVAEEHGPIS